MMTLEVSNTQISGNLDWLLIEREKIRSRLNHDTLKNKVVQGLQKLRAVLTGAVNSVESVEEIFETIDDQWQYGKDQLEVFTQIKMLKSENELMSHLPFVRHLNTQEKIAIRRMLEERITYFVTSQWVCEVRQALNIANVCIATVRASTSGEEDISLEDLDNALKSVRALSQTLGDPCL